MKTAIRPIISAEILNSIQPGPRAGAELMKKQWSSKAIIILKDDEGSEIERLEYQAEDGMTPAEFKTSLYAEAKKLREAEAL